MDLVKVLSSDLNEIRNKSGKILTMANNLQTLPDSIENFNETLTPVCGSVLKLTKLSTNLDELEKEILDNIKAKYEKTTTPEYAAARLWVDAIIDPLETRKVISMGIEAANHNPEFRAFNPGVIQT